MIDVLIVLGGLWLAAFGICAVLFAVAFFFGAPISAYRHKRREERTARTMAAFEEQGASAPSVVTSAPRGEHSPWTTTTLAAQAALRAGSAFAGCSAPAATWGLGIFSMTRTAFGRPCPTFLEVIQLSEKLDLGIVVASAVKRTLGFYPEADRNDLSQEAWLWLYDHPARVERDADKPKTASWRLTRDLGAHLGDICRREKAQALGYKPEDEYRYGKAMVALALPAAIAGTTEPPTFVREEIAKRTDPSEGGNWMALLADMGMAWEHADLTEQQRELLVDYYCEDMTQDEIANMIGITQRNVVTASMPPRRS